MYSTKAACLNHVNFCRFPEGVHSIKEFVAFLNAHYHTFVELEVYRDKGCVAPFFIDGDTERQFWNPSLVRLVEESDVHLFAKEEYDEKLKEVISQKCVQCVYYSEDNCKWDMEAFCEHISLNGDCIGFEKK